ncbi:MAG: response regulator [bacterium]
MAICYIGQTLVESEGYEVVTAQDGLQAFKILHNDSNFRAIILDMQMPHMEGSDLLRQMQTEKRLSRIPVLMMISSVDLKVLSGGFGPGAMAFIPKPFTPAQMRNTLRLIALKDINLTTFPVSLLNHWLRIPPRYY